MTSIAWAIFTVGISACTLASSALGEEWSDDARGGAAILFYAGLTGLIISSIVEWLS